MAQACDPKCSGVWCRIPDSKGLLGLQSEFKTSVGNLMRPYLKKYLGIVTNNLYSQHSRSWNRRTAMSLRPVLVINQTSGTQPHCVALCSTDLTTQTELASNSQRSTCYCLSTVSPLCFLRQDLSLWPRADWFAWANSPHAPRIFLFSMLGTERKSLCLHGKHFPTELSPQYPIFWWNSQAATYLHLKYAE